MLQVPVNPFTTKLKKYICPTLKKCTGEAVRIGSMIIFHLNKLSERVKGALRSKSCQSEIRSLLLQTKDWHTISRFSESHSFHA